MIDDVKVWRLTPEQIANYQFGMDLGKPHEIQKYEPYQVSDIEKKMVKARQKRGIETRYRNRKKINEELYKEHKAAGLSDKEIAFKYKIKHATLTQYKHLWRKKRSGSND